MERSTPLRQPEDEPAQPECLVSATLTDQLFSVRSM